MSPIDAADLFTTSPNTIEAQAASLAEEIAIEDDALTQLDRELKARKAKLDQAKEDLARLLMAHGVDSVKFNNGLNPQAKVTRKYFKASGVTDEQLHRWLADQGLDDIIRPSVPWQTLQATLKGHDTQGHEIPGTIIQTNDQPTIRMGGKSKFLAGRQGADVTG
ncbi:hypothetical protein ACFL6U_09815 [Planctomycetota bacterium]